MACDSNLKLAHTWNMKFVNPKNSDSSKLDFEPACETYELDVIRKTTATTMVLRADLLPTSIQANVQQHMLPAVDSEMESSIPGCVLLVQRFL